jgi:hypothetical protein
MRYMFILKSSTPPSAPAEGLMKAMHEMAQREVRAGRMIADGGLAPRSTATEVRLHKQKLAVLDGPFTETKEVIAGFAIFELPDHQAAVDCAKDFLGLHQEHLPDAEFTMEIREIAGSQVEMIRLMAST